MIESWIWWHPSQTGNQLYTSLRNSLRQLLLLHSYSYSFFFSFFYTYSLSSSLWWLYLSLPPPSNFFLSLFNSFEKCAGLFAANAPASQQIATIFFSFLPGKCVSVYFWAVFIFISGKWESYNVSSHKSLSLLVFFLFEEGNKIRLLIRLEAYTRLYGIVKRHHIESGA